MTNGVLDAALRDELVRELEQLNRIADEGDEGSVILMGRHDVPPYGRIVARPRGAAQAERRRSLLSMLPVPVVALAANLPDVADRPSRLDIEVKP